jgi:hypothetical protein
MFDFLGLFYEWNWNKHECDNGLILEIIGKVFIRKI